MSSIQQKNFRRINNVHFIGIGGVGMAGIAEVMFNIGYHITGSDLSKNNFTKKLESFGIEIKYCHLADNVKQADAVVFSSAVREDNVELLYAKQRKIPIVPRAEMLAELMRFKQGIAIAGTHGKTTTTSLISTIFAAANLDPTYVVGGRINSIKTNAKLGSGAYFIAEADESDASFLHLTPSLSVVTNIDYDHLATYNHSPELLLDTFVKFIHNIPFYGLAVLCMDDENINKILPRLHRPVVTYGFNTESDAIITSWQVFGMQTKFTLLIKKINKSYNFTLNLMGKHNVLNASAAILVALEADIPVDVIANSLNTFQGVMRRLQIIGEYKTKKGNFTLIDDYGHHPTELTAVISALRGTWPDRRIVMIFQPHRYSRTKDLFNDFAQVLSHLDVLIMLPVYAAGEKEITGIDSDALCNNIRAFGLVEPILVNYEDQLLTVMQNIIMQNDIVITQGAGDVSKISALIAAEFTTNG